MSILLFILFFIKHFLADYPLQSPYMLRKVQLTGWKLPLATHCLVHVSLTFLLLAFFIPIWVAILLAGLEFILHFVIDYWKAQKCRYPTTDSKFWIALGFDQLLHYLTYALIIFLIV